MKYLRLIITLSIACAFSGCKGTSTETDLPSGSKFITHYNVVMLPDLSNRLKRSAGFPDVEILRSLLQNIYPKIAKYKRAVNQKDRYSVVLSSKKLGTIYDADFSKMTIDLDAFGIDQKARIDYLTGNTTGRTLKKDKAAFVNEFMRMEKQAKPETDGADIWSFFNTGINQSLVAVPEKAMFTYENQEFHTRFKNVLILFTDGYIEAAIYGTKGCEGNHCQYLSGQLIKDFRQSFLRRADKTENLISFFTRNKYGITPVNNPYLKYFEVLVMEVDDRSLTNTGNATANPADYEIIKMFWEDWMKKSGVQHFELHPVSRDAREAEQNILSFMGIK